MPRIDIFNCFFDGGVQPLRIAVAKIESVQVGQMFGFAAADFIEQVLHLCGEIVVDQRR